MGKKKSQSEESLEAFVRRVDEDRFFASRFAEPEARKRVLALYAANHEIAKTAEMVSDELVGAIRLQWWKDAIADIYSTAQPPQHPVAQALAAAIAQARLPRAEFEALLSAREKDVETIPFNTWKDLEAYVDATSGGLMRLAALACAPDFQPSDDQALAIKASGRLWGYTGLVRALPFWSARARTFYPMQLLERLKISPEAAVRGGEGHERQAAIRAVLDRANAARADAVRLARTLPAAVFPAVSYAALAPVYAGYVLRDGVDVAARPGRDKFDAFMRRVKLVSVTALGSL